MLDDASNRLLMSDSIKGMIPDLEEDKVKNMNDAFLVGVFEIIYDSFDDIDVMAGKVEGISFESQGDIKIDVRLDTKKAYDTIKKYTTTGLTCTMAMMSCVSKAIIGFLVQSCSILTSKRRCAP